MELKVLHDYGVGDRTATPESPPAPTTLIDHAGRASGHGSRLRRHLGATPPLERRRSWGHALPEGRKRNASEARLRHRVQLDVEPGANDVQVTTNGAVAHVHLSSTQSIDEFRLGERAAGRGVVRWSQKHPTGVNPGVDGILTALEAMGPIEATDGGRVGADEAQAPGRTRAAS